MNKKKISVFISDDTYIAIFGIEQILKTDNELFVTGKSTEAIETINEVRRIRPDVLIVDLMWGKDSKTGYVIIRRVKEDNPKIKIIAITNYENMVDEARLLGADMAMSKIVRPDDLIIKIKQLYETKNGFLAPIIRKDEKWSEKLTKREIEILTLVKKGESDKEIAIILGIKASTVKNHMSRILSKLSSRNRTEAVIKAEENTII